MGFIGFFFSHYLALGILVAVSWIFGAHLTQKIAFDSTIERAAFSITLGFGVVSHITLLLGLLGLLSLRYVVGALILGLAVSFRTWRPLVHLSGFMHRVPAVAMLDE